MALQISQRACFKKGTTPLCFSLKRNMSNDSTIGLANPAAYCRDFVRKHDYESFLVSQFYPKAAQNGFFAIKAFSVCFPLARDHQLSFARTVATVIGRIGHSARQRVKRDDWSNENGLLERRFKGDS